MLNLKLVLTPGVVEQTLFMQKSIQDRTGQSEDVSQCVQVSD